MKKIKVGINGYGRIGKMVFRILLNHPEIEIAGINDPMPENSLLYLMKYDTVFGILNETITAGDDSVMVGKRHIPVSRVVSPAEIPWKKWGVEVVIDSSGRNKDRESLQQHIVAGAQKVILTCPAVSPVDKTVIIGVNEHTLAAGDHIVSNASCTANCVAPLLKIISDSFGIETGFLNTVHPYTNNQQLIDSPHKDLRRGRNAGVNIIPTSSTAIKCVLEVLPELGDRFSGIATRVPVPDGALTELVLRLKSIVTITELNIAVKHSSKTSMKGIVSYINDPVVSSDIIGNPHSCVFDSLATKVINGDTVQLLSWYDNEFGYSNRVVDLIGLMAKFIR
ncbi:MAG TPA: type I glyceraldehyde-3-phosphate dehydrogenase [Bacteroidales bacterium]|nr:type I glyceraldehyde-3-phosphate dehydrogenase [Bacteroidales bacterium]